MKVCRYSDSGFTAHHQGHLEMGVKYLLAQDFSQIPTHLVHFLKESVKEINENWKNQLRGFWVFVGEKSAQDDEYVRHQLNHLKSNEGFKWHETELDSETLCYPAHKALRGTPRKLKEFSPGDAVYVIVSND